MRVPKPVTPKELWALAEKVAADLARKAPLDRRRLLKTVKAQNPALGAIVQSMLATTR